MCAYALLMCAYVYAMHVDCCQVHITGMFIKDVDDSKEVVEHQAITSETSESSEMKGFTSVACFSLIFGAISGGPVADPVEVVEDEAGTRSK